MARRRQKRSSAYDRGQRARQSSIDANLQLLTRALPLRLRDIEDRRENNPLGHRPMRTNARPAYMQVAPMRRTSPSGSRKRRSLRVLPLQPTFALPKSTIVCVRRNQRREVLFAKGVGGGKVSKRRRRNSNSEISCRRT